MLVHSEFNRFPYGFIMTVVILKMVALRRSTFCVAEQAGERGRRNGRPNSFSHQELTRRIAKSLDFSLYHKARNVNLISSTVVKQDGCLCPSLFPFSPPLPVPLMSHVHRHTCSMAWQVF